jgi:hypothetical protein
MIPTPKFGEEHVDFIERCMSDEIMLSEYPNEKQRIAVCASNIKMAKEKVSFDYDGVLSTKAGSDLARSLTNKATIYIISARGHIDVMSSKAKELGINSSNVFATGSNKAKVQKILDLGISIHYDNNPDVIKELGSIGKLLK